MITTTTKNWSCPACARDHGHAPMCQASLEGLAELLDAGTIAKIQRIARAAMWRRKWQEANKQTNNEQKD